MVISEVQGMKTPEISTINRGEKNTEQAIMLYEFVILTLLDFYVTKWEDEQIRECAEMLFSEYYWLQIAELKHLCVLLKTGKMMVPDGKNLVAFKPFGKFSPSDLMRCFDQYAHESLIERQYAFERQSCDDRHHERWNSHDERLKSNSEAYTMNGLILQEKSKLKKNEQDKNVD